MKLFLSKKVKEECRLEKKKVETYNQETQKQQEQTERYESQTAEIEDELTYFIWGIEDMQLRTGWIQSLENSIFPIIHIMIPFTRQIIFAGKNSAAFLPLLSSSRFWFAAKTVSLPFLAESIHEGTIKGFNRKEGQWVNQDDTIAHVQTEKANVTVRSPHSGLITKCHVRVGDRLQVGGALFDVDLDANKPQHQQKSESQPSQSQTDQNADSSSSKSQSGQNVGSSATKTQYGQSHNVGFESDKPSPGQNKSPAGQNVGFDSDKSYSKQSQPQTSQTAGLNSAQNLGSDFDKQLPSGYANSANPPYAAYPDPDKVTKSKSTEDTKTEFANGNKPEYTHSVKPESKQNVSSNPTSPQSGQTHTSPDMGPNPNETKTNYGVGPGFNVKNPAFGQQPGTKSNPPPHGQNTSSTPNIPGSGQRDPEPGSRKPQPGQNEENPSDKVIDRKHHKDGDNSSGEKKK